MFQLDQLVQEEQSLLWLLPLIKKSTIVLLGPGKNNTLGMVPGVLNVTDGSNTVNIATPGFQSVVFK